MTGRPDTARALVLIGTRSLEFRQLEIPDPAASAALLRVEACGLCGTDHEMFTGHLPMRTPMVPGHETVGVLVEVGDVAAGAWGVAVGDRVAVECFRSCRRCGPCLAGNYRRCGANGLRTAYGLSPMDVQPALSGGWADHHWLDIDSMLVPVPDGVEAVDATLFNPVGAGIRWGAELPATGPGDVVAVLGPGIRGLAAAAAARVASSSVSSWSIRAFMAASCMRMAARSSSASCASRGAGAAQPSAMIASGKRVLRGIVQIT